jgi:predicted ATPase
VCCSLRRARAARNDFHLNADNEDAIIEICDRLDHIPLAIELAASRARAMSPADIAKLLDQRFCRLASRDRGVPGRHQTLEAALRWSYELLDESLQLVLARLSLFVAPFTLGAVEAVVADEEQVESWAVLEAILGLVDKSLVVARDHEETTRYHLLESVRQFAAAELDRDWSHIRFVLREAVSDPRHERFDTLYGVLGPAFISRGRSNEGMLGGLS